MVDFLWFGGMAPPYRLPIGEIEERRGKAKNPGGTVFAGRRNKKGKWRARRRALIDRQTWAADQAVAQPGTRIFSLLEGEKEHSPLSICRALGAACDAKACSLSRE